MFLDKQFLCRHIHITNIDINFSNEFVCYNKRDLYGQMIPSRFLCSINAKEIYILYTYMLPTNILQNRNKNGG